MNSKVTNIIFGLICTALLPIFVFLFYRYTIMHNGLYFSDFITYIEWSQQSDAPPRAIETIWGALLQIDGSTVYIALFQSTVVVATIVVVYLLIKYLIRLRKARLSGPIQISSAVMSLLVLFGTSIAIPLIYPNFYLAGGAWGRYTWHSPSQLIMVLFGLIAVSLFVKLYYDQNNTKNESAKSIIYYVQFAAALVLSAWAKPSFIMCFLPAVAILLVYDAVKSRKLRWLIPYALSIVPTLIYFGMLYLSFYGDDAARGTQIAPGTTFLHFHITLGSGLLSLAFPLVVLAHNYKQLRNNLPYKLSWLVFGVALLIAFMLAETGDNTFDGNFLWGLWFGVLLVFITSVAVYIGNLQSANKAYLLVAGLIFLLHTGSGLFYFNKLLHGASYVQ